MDKFDDLSIAAYVDAAAHLLQLPIAAGLSWGTREFRVMRLAALFLDASTSR
jgi:hypothetical protein